MLVVTQTPPAPPPPPLAPLPLPPDAPLARSQMPASQLAPAGTVSVPEPVTSWTIQNDIQAGISVQPARMVPIDA